MGSEGDSQVREALGVRGDGGCSGEDEYGEEEGEGDWPAGVKRNGR